MTVLDPCFRCILPYCDEANPGCMRRAVLTVAHRKRKRQEPLTEEELYIYRERQRDWKRADRERRAQAAAS